MKNRKYPFLTETEEKDFTDHQFWRAVAYYGLGLATGGVICFLTALIFGI